MRKTALSFGLSALVMMSLSAVITPCTAEEAPAVTAIRTLLDSSLPSGWKASYGTIDYRADNDTVSIRNLRLTPIDSALPEISAEILEADHLDVDVLSAIASDTTIRASAPLADEIRVTGLKARQTRDFALSVRQLSASDVTMASPDMIESTRFTFREGTFRPLQKDIKDIYRDMGYTDLPVFDGGGNFRFSRDDGRIVLDNTWLSSDQVGRFDLVLDLIGYFPEQAARGRDTSLSSLRLRYQDASLVDRIFTYMARKNGKKPQATRQESVAFLAVTRLALGMKAQKAGDVLEKAITFLEKPESFDLSLNPKKPVSLNAFGEDGLPDNPDLIVDMLGLNLKVNE